jgi:two-component system sensor histidine kinase ChvG
VSDTGPGLRPDQLERVFERFYSEQEGGLGSGLGLPIARAIAEAHGGTLEASSQRGARFELLLPLAPPQSESADAAQRRGGSD